MFDAVSVRDTSTISAMSESSSAIDGMSSFSGSSSIMGGGAPSFASMGIWIAISLVIAILAGIVLYFTVFAKRKEGKYKGFMKWLYNFMFFKNLMLESLLRLVYIIIAIFITLSSFAVIPISFIGFLLYLILGNIITRIIFEFSIVLLKICENTSEINIKLAKPKVEEEK